MMCAFYQEHDDDDDIQVAQVSEQFLMIEAKTNPVYVEDDDDNFGRFSPEAVAAVEALILESNTTGNPSDDKEKTDIDHVDHQAYKV